MTATSGEQNYLDLLTRVLTTGNTREDRTGTGTLSLFGEQLRFDLRESFPLLTTKKIHFKSVVHELLWMISGSTNVKPLQEHGVTIWDEWADEDGELGPVYGRQWRDFGSNEYRDIGGIDQLSVLMERLKTDPYSRRHVVTAWNPREVDQAALPPCHTLFQFYVNAGELSCHLYQRSADIFLGVPFNIASYALLTKMVASVTGFKPGTLVISYGDVHLYSNHVEQAKEQLTRSVKTAPTMQVRPRASLFDYRYEDITLEGYDPHPAIKAPVAV